MSWCVFVRKTNVSKEDHCTYTAKQILPVNFFLAGFEICFPCKDVSPLSISLQATFRFTKSNLKLQIFLYCIGRAISIGHIIQRVNEMPLVNRGAMANKKEPGN